MTIFVFFKPSFPNKDKEASEFPESSNPDPNWAIFQNLKYSENDFKQILKTVLEV